MTSLIIYFSVLVLLGICIFLTKNVTKTQKIIFIICALFATIIILMGLYKDFFFCSKSSLENYGFFKFIDDAANIEANPEIYCGSDLLVPDDYDRMGTRVQCLKKGIGIGMAMPNAQRDSIINRPPSLIGPRPNVYCGNGDILPPNYTSLGNPYQCLKKGVGAGMRLPDAQRIAFQQRPPRPLGKKEIMTLARRFGISTHDKTRAQTLHQIAGRLE